jgi:hypothetical protein
MKQMMHTRFFSLGYEQYLSQQYQKCLQGNRYLHVYNVEFHKVVEHNKPLEDRRVANYMISKRVETNNQKYMNYR